MASTSSAHKVFISGDIVGLRKSIKQAQKELDSLQAKKVYFENKKNEAPKKSAEKEKYSKELKEISSSIKNAKTKLRGFESELKQRSKSYFKDYIQGKKIEEAKHKAMENLRNLGFSDNRAEQRKAIIQEYSSKVKAYKEQEQEFQKIKEQANKERKKKEYQELQKRRYIADVMSPSEKERYELREAIKKRRERDAILSNEDKKISKERFKQQYKAKIEEERRLQNERDRYQSQVDKERKKKKYHALKQTRYESNLMTQEEKKKYEQGRDYKRKVERIKELPAEERTKIKQELKQQYKAKIEEERRLQNERDSREREQRIQSVYRRSSRDESVSSRLNRIREVTEDTNIPETRRAEIRRTAVQNLRDEARQERQSRRERAFEVRNSIMLENDSARARFAHANAIRTADRALRDNIISEREYRLAVQRLNRDLQSQVGLFGRASNQTVRAIRQLESYFVALGAIYFGIRATIGAGNEYNKIIERESVGMQMLIAQNTIYFNQNKKVLNSYQSMEQASLDAKKALDEVIRINPQTPHDLTQTLQIFKLLLPQVMKLGGGIKETGEITKGLSILAAAQGVEFENLLKTADSALSGEMLESGLKRALTQFDITNEKIKELKENGGNVVAYILDKLKSVEPAGDKIFNSWEGAMSQFKNSWDSTWGKIEEPLFEDMKKLAMETSKTINENQESIVTASNAIGKAVVIGFMGIAMAGTVRALKAVGASLLSVGNSAMVSSGRLLTMSLSMNSIWLASKRLLASLSSLRTGLVLAVPTYFAMDFLQDYFEDASTKADRLISRLNKTRDVLAAIPIQEKKSIKYELEVQKKELNKELKDAKASEKIDIKIKIQDIDSAIALIDSISDKETKAQIEFDKLSKEIAEITKKYQQASSVKDKFFGASKDKTAEELREEANKLIPTIPMQTSDEAKKKIANEVNRLATLAKSMDDSSKLVKTLEEKNKKLKEEQDIQKDILKTVRGITSEQKKASSQIEYTAEKLLAIQNQMLASKEEIKTLDLKIKVQKDKVTPPDMEKEEQKRKFLLEKRQLSESNKKIRERAKEARGGGTPLSESEQKELDLYKKQAEAIQKKIKLIELEQESSQNISRLSVAQKEYELQNETVKALQLKKKIIEETPTLTQSEKDIQIKEVNKELRDYNISRAEQKIDAKISLLESQMQGNLISEDLAKQEIRQLNIEKIKLSEKPQEIKAIEIKQLNIKPQTFREDIERERKEKEIQIRKASLQQKKDGKKEDEVDEKERISLIENEIFHKEKILNQEKTISKQKEIQLELNQLNLEKQEEIFYQEKRRVEETEKRYSEYASDAIGLIEASKSEDVNALSRATFDVISKNIVDIFGNNLISESMRALGALFSTNVTQEEIKKSKGITFEDQSISQLTSSIQNAYAPLLEVNKEMRDHLKNMDYNFKGVSINFNTLKDYTPYSKGNIWGSKQISLNGVGIDFGEMNYNNLSAKGYKSEVQTKSSWLGLKKSTSIIETQTELPEDTQEALRQAFKDGYSIIFDATATLGVQEADDAIKNSTTTIGKLNLEGMNRSQVQQELSRAYGEYFSQVVESSDTLNIMLQKYAEAGEDTLATLGRISNTYEQSSYQLEKINGLLDRTFVLDFSQALGGDSGVSSAIGGYVSNFYTQSEQQEMKMKELKDSFKALNLVMPQTASSFREMVESFKGSGKDFASLISLSSKFSETISHQKKAIEDISSFLLGEYSFFSLSQKEMYSKTLAVDDIRRVEIASKTAKTQDEFNLISKQYLLEISKNANKDYQKEIRDNILRLNELTEASLKKLSEINTSVRIAGV